MHLVGCFLSERNSEIYSAKKNCRLFIPLQINSEHMKSMNYINYKNIQQQQNYHKEIKSFKISHSTNKIYQTQITNII